MATVKSGINKVGNNYYQSITMDTPDGSVGTTLYRVDANGGNGVPIYDVDRSAGSDTLNKSFDPNATEEEQRLLSDPNSQLSQVRAEQVRSSNPYSANFLTTVSKGFLISVFPDSDNNLLISF